MRRLTTRAEILADHSAGKRRGVVMTMGALHEGHASLIRAARQTDDHVTVTIFVNPMQFGANEDLDKYPRSLDADLGLCEALGVDTVFTPASDQIYGPDAVVSVDPGPLGSDLEGAARPGHFRGVLTVVMKLLNLTAAHDAYFGEKDYQQLTLIRSMVKDLDAPVNVVGVPTSREPDGLARSSRNVYLSGEQRQLAAAIPSALRAGRLHTDVAAIEAAATAELAGLDIDYAVVRGPDLSAPTPGPCRLLIAARVGSTRLLDNCAVEVR